ncbi:MAG: hypothetical protein IKA32_00910, partial [Lentisphaeria bacterium]|nr:hypothetical protein [Lentisphaeria bacterium]
TFVITLSSTGRSEHSVVAKVNFCKLFLKIFSVLTGKAGGFIDLKVYNKNSGEAREEPAAAVPTGKSVRDF